MVEWFGGKLGQKAGSRFQQLALLLAAPKQTAKALSSSENPPAPWRGFGSAIASDARHHVKQRADQLRGQIDVERDRVDALSVAKRMSSRKI